MRKNLYHLSLLISFFLSACATVETPTRLMSEKAVVTAAAPAIAASVPLPDLTSAQQICSTLKSQFQIQLPLQVQSQLHWQAVATHNPLQANAILSPACQISWQTSGFTIEKYGLTPDFVTATLERLNWQGNAQTNAYTADSPVGHQEALANGDQLALINYTFAPPAHVCPSGQPIAACKFSKKKWRYDLKVWIFPAPPP